MTNYIQTFLLKHREKRPTQSNQLDTKLLEIQLKAPIHLQLIDFKELLTSVDIGFLIVAELHNVKALPKNM